MLSVFISSGIQNQIAFRPANTGQAGAGLRLGVGLFQIIHRAGLDGDNARAAAAGAAAGVNFHALCMGEVEQVPGGRFPMNCLARAAEGDVDFRQMSGFLRRGRGGFFLHGRRAERLEVNVLVRHAPRFEAVGEALHERAAAAEVILEIVRRQQLLEQLDAHAAFVLVVAAFDIVRTGFAVGDVQMNVFIFRRQLFQLGLVDVLAPVAHAEEEPHLALRTAGSDGAGHAQHRRDADAAGDEHHGIGPRQIQAKMARGRLDVEDVAFRDGVAKITGSRARRQIGFVRRRLFLFDGDAVIVLPVRAVGKRVAAHERLVAPRQIELERQVLPRFESRQRTTIMRLEIKGANIVALRILFDDGEFSETVPAELRLPGFAAAEPGFQQLRVQFFERDPVLGALGIRAEQRADDFDREPKQQSGQQSQSGDKAQAASTGAAQ